MGFEARSTPQPRIPRLARRPAVVFAAVLFRLWPQPSSASLTQTAESVIAALAFRMHTVASFSADLTISVRMRSFPFLHGAFHGTTTYQNPGKFSVSLRQTKLAKNYESALNDIGEPVMWVKNYAIDAGRIESVGPKAMAICLVPRIGGNLNRTIATVDMSNMTVSQVDWYYNDGGHIAMRQQFALVGGTLMVVHQDIDIATPSLRVAVAADLGNYSIRRSETAVSFTRSKVDR